jgi:hypothetical protein
MRTIPKNGNMDVRNDITFTLISTSDRHGEFDTTMVLGNGGCLKKSFSLALHPSKALLHREISLEYNMIGWWRLKDILRRRICSVNECGDDNRKIARAHMGCLR